MTHEHPELKEKFEEWCKMLESEERELKEIIHQILAKARKDDESLVRRLGVE